MGTLCNLGLIDSKNKSKTDSLFDGLLGTANYLTVNYQTPQEYVRKYWNAYQNSGMTNNALNGKMFEAIIATLFIREQITPFYFQAKIAFVPDIDFDFVLYKEEEVTHPVEGGKFILRKPYAISLKTSLRERWKQADLEAKALNNVYRNGNCYLISLHEKEVENINKRISIGDAIGLKKAYYCFSSEFDAFIEELKGLRPFSESKMDIQVIDGKPIK